MKRMMHEISFRKSAGKSYCWEAIKKKYGYVIVLYRNNNILKNGDVEIQRTDVVSFYVFSLRSDYFSKSFKRAIDLHCISIKDFDHKFLEEFHTEVFTFLSRSYQIHKSIPLFRLMSGKHRELWMDNLGEKKKVDRIGISFYSEGVWKISLNRKHFIVDDRDKIMFCKKLLPVIRNIEILHYGVIDV